MSHFSLMVITEEPPTDEVLSRLLQPFHEFECTGINDQYVVDVDKTEEFLNDYNTRKIDRLRYVNDWMSSSSLHRASDRQFFRDSTPEEEKKIGKFGGTGFTDGLSYYSQNWGDGRGYRPKIKYVPPHFEEIEVPVNQIMTLAEFHEYEHGEDKVVVEGEEPDLDGPHKYGYIVLGDNGTRVVKVVDRTNPRKRWDWWTVGGRWSGFFATFYDPHKDPANFEYCFLCGGTGKRLDMEVENGCNACGGRGMALKHPPKWRKVGNTIQVGHLKLKEMQDEAARKALEAYDKAMSVIAGRPVSNWSELRAKADAQEITWKEARDLYNSDPVIEDLAKADFHSFNYEMEDLFKTREQIDTEARGSAIATFAVLHDGKWYERGEMGWWGHVSNEQDRASWGCQVTKLIEGLSSDTWLTVVDCHI